MREIKFRAREVATDEWVIGSSSPQGEECSLAVFFANVQIGKFDPETVGQHPGLKDKNGREIYGGDIVRTHPHPRELNPVREPCVVEFATYGIQLYIDGKQCVYGPDDSTEVIGNIYENPELLEK